MLLLLWTYSTNILKWQCKAKNGDGAKVRKKWSRNRRHNRN